MSETTDSDQPGRSCPNCGVEIRQGNVFCTSCGANLVPDDEASEHTQAEATPEGMTGENRGDDEGTRPHESGDERGPDSPPDPGRKGDIAGYAARFSVWFKREIVEGGVRPGKSNHDRAGSGRVGGGLTEILWGMSGRVVRRFNDLPTVTTRVVAAVMAVLGGVVLLLLLSPVAYLVAMLVLVSTLVALLVQVVRRRAIRGWGIVAMASLVLILVSGVASNLVYNTNYLGGIGYQLSVEEQGYIREVDKINGRVSKLSTNQERLMKAYPRLSVQEVQEANSNNLLADMNYLEAKEDIKVPEGCEDHHEAFVTAVTERAASVQIAGRYVVNGDRNDESDWYLADIRAKQSTGKAKRLLEDVRKRGCKR